MDKLTERGFVSIIGNEPYWIMLQFNQPWLWIWNTHGRIWAELRQLTDADVITYRAYKVSDISAQLYHNGDRVNYEYGKIPQDETTTDIPLINEEIIGGIQKVVDKNNPDSNPDFGKIKGSVINLIRESTDIIDLISRLVEAKQQLNELLTH